jgi:predicted RNase H-like HicB family nuclease
MKAAYPIILTKGVDYILAYVPDFGINTQGTDEMDAIAMARDAISLVGVDMQDDNLPLPAPSALAKIQKENANAAVTLVAVDFTAYRREISSPSSTESPPEPEPGTPDLTGVKKLNKKLKNTVGKITRQEARSLVDAYYRVQEWRIASANQLRKLLGEEETDGEDATDQIAPPEVNDTNTVLGWLLQSTAEIEKQLRKSLDWYTDASPIGKWCKSIMGVGPVTAAALLSYIDIEKAPTAGHIWAYAGLDPTKTWQKGEIRPWNARLKKTCWYIGQGFLRTYKKPESYYGQIYAVRKEYETTNNEKLLYEDQAKKILQDKKIGKTTEAYKYYSEGKLPPAHINQRAQRYAVKLFLAHLHEVWYKYHYGVDPPKPYALAHLGHVDKIDPPNQDMLL